MPHLAGKNTGLVNLCIAIEQTFLAFLLGKFYIGNNFRLSWPIECEDKNAESFRKSLFSVPSRCQPPPLGNTTGIKGLP